jgi:uncharacterized protein
MSNDRNHPVGQFESYVQDMRRAIHEAGESGARNRHGIAFLMQQTGYGATGALVKMPGFGSGANRVLVYFSCADPAVEAAKAENAGGRIEKPKMSIGPYSHIALVFDTEGNLIGPHSMQ